MKIYLKLLFSVLFLVFTACKKSINQEIINNQHQFGVKYAKGFDIIVDDSGVKKLIIKKPYQAAEKAFEYTLTTKTNIIKNELKVPVERMIVSSTSHIPMLELLESESNLIGFPNTRFISSKKTRALIDSGKVHEIGHEQNINTEKLLELSPDLVVGFSLTANDKVYSNIERLGIPMIYNGDWLEKTPLGRAEWIKFFGVLLGKEKEADSIFNQIENNYLQAKKAAQESTKKLTILAGSLFKDIWYVPAAESFKSTFFKDANLLYLWKETKGTGSIPLSFEIVLEKGIQSDFWIGCGLFETKQQMLSANKHYAKFQSFQNSRIYNIAKRKGATGGMIYFELSPVRPDLVLKDIIKITNPDLLPNYTLTFFDPVQ